MTNPPHEAKHAKPGRVEGAVWEFYLAFVVFLALEGVIVAGLTRAGKAMGFGSWSICFTLLIFGLGSVGLGLDAHHRKSVEKALRDPLNRLGLWLWERAGWTGLFLYNLTLGGPIGVGIVLKKHEHPCARLLIVAAGVVFTLVWVPLYQYGIVDKL